VADFISLIRFIAAATVPELKKDCYRLIKLCSQGEKNQTGVFNLKSIPNPDLYAYSG
jgi:hypothetical protein